MEIGYGSRNARDCVFSARSSSRWKSLFLSAFFISALAGSAFGQAFDAAETTVGDSVSIIAASNALPVLSSAARWEAKPESAHSTSWTKLSLSSNSITHRIITNRTAAYTEVGNFLNAQDPDTGIWEKSQPRFVVTATGLESR